MKDLIVISTYCPDSKRKEALHSLIQNLQKVREKYDIMVVSHSSISELSMLYVDHVYIDNKNELIKDYDITNRFWYSSKPFTVASSLIYTSSTHYAIYSLMHYIINFSRFRNYKKIHYMEYDVILDTNIIDIVNKKLDTYDNVIFNDGWESGYFAFKTDNFPEIYFTHNKEFILQEIKGIDNKMTEKYTLKFINVNNRNTYNFNLNKDFDEIPFARTIDSHENHGLMWCVPVYVRNTNKLELFTWNEKGGIAVNCDGNYQTFKNKEIGHWSIIPLGDINDINKIEIIINGKLKKEILLNSKNIEKFCENNYIKYHNQ